MTRALFTADSQRVITVAMDKSVRIWDLATGETLQTYRLPMGPGDEGSRRLTRRDLDSPAFPVEEGRFNTTLRAKARVVVRYRPKIDFLAAGRAG